MVPRDGIFSVAAMRSHHLVERSHAVALLEFVDAFADGLDDAGDVIALVKRSLVREVLRTFPIIIDLVKNLVREKSSDFITIRIESLLPVFGVAAREDDFGQNLTGSRLGDGDVFDCHRGPFGDERFFHGGCGADLGCDRGESIDD